LLLRAIRATKLRHAKRSSLCGALAKRGGLNGFYDQIKYISICREYKVPKWCIKGVNW
jgi:hypothetical protein